MYNCSFPLHLVSVMTDGHCGLVARGPTVKQIADLRGRRVGVPFFNGFTGPVMLLVLAHRDVSLAQVTLAPATTRTALVLAMISHVYAGPRVLGDVSLVTKPGEVVALLRRGLDKYPDALSSGMRQRVARQACLVRSIHRPIKRGPN